MGKINYRELAFKLFCWGIIGVASLLFFKYLFKYTVPFLIAWGVAYLIYPLANKLSAKTKISRKFCSFSLMLLLLILLSAVVFLIFNRLFYEIQNLFDYLIENGDTIANYFQTVFDSVRLIGERLPIINKLQNTELAKAISDNINAFITGIWESILGGLSSAVPDFAARIVGGMPSAILVFLVTIVACFYFAVDINLFHSKLKSVLPQGVVAKLHTWKEKISFGLKRYFKAYLILFLITFTELFIGFLILGIDYSFVISILISLVDFLPVFGAPAVLLPWAIVLLVMKKTFVGIGMMILLVIIMIVRQVLEPKILGKNLGVHPLVTLVALYIGFELFGLLGMVILPIIIPIIFSKGEEKGA